MYRANIASLQLMTEELVKKDMHIFAISNIRKRGNWGSSWSKWLKPNTPEITIPYYSNGSKKVMIDILSGDVKVNSFTVNADNGFNEASFDVSFSKKGKKDYLKANKDANISKAKNGAYYLPKGKYTVKIGDAESKFEIK